MCVCLCGFVNFIHVTINETIQAKNGKLMISEANQKIHEAKRPIPEQR
jgi:hypothetical protein